MKQILLVTLILLAERGGATAPPTKKVKFSESDLTPYREIAGWPTWMCADFKDGRSSSVWYAKAKGKTTAQSYEKKCDDWIQSEHPVVIDDFPEVAK